MTPLEEERNEFNKFNKKKDKFLLKVSSFISHLPEIPGYSLKAIAAEHICFEAINFGSMNAYEAVGILECVKRKYLEILEEVSSESDESFSRQEEDEEEFDEEEELDEEEMKKLNLH